MISKVWRHHIVPIFRRIYRIRYYGVLYLIRKNISCLLHQLISNLSVLAAGGHGLADAAIIRLLRLAHPRHLTHHWHAARISRPHLRIDLARLADAAGHATRHLYL